jgi:glycosyltransferase involved in cell wall biosynthesis
MRILFLQPSLQPPGGGNGVAAWMLEALKDDHAVTAFTWAPVALDEMNRFWGTSLAPGDVRLLRVPARVRRLVDALPLPLSMLRTAVMLRIARRLRGQYDVPVTANNEADFGMVGVQYVHYPWNVFPRLQEDYRWYHLRPLLAAYYRLCTGLSGFTPGGMHHNVTLVNSDWTGRLAQQRYGFASRTVYPPVTGAFPDVPWHAREPGFVCVGRISPEKELDRVIDIVTAVRRRVPEVTLHLVGTGDHGAYHRRIAGRVRAAGFTLHEDLSRGALAALVARQRYGIHGMREEHFGMAPAEMVRAGCVVWVPDGGGQVEIVDDPRLVYGSVDEAIATILRVLRDPHEETTLRKHLAGRAPLFSAERFMVEVRQAVADAAHASRETR